jgi:hypothetical protein
MKKKRYRRKCGEFEVRVLADGRVVMLAPDEQLLRAARKLDPKNELLPPETESTKNAGK